MNKQRRAEISAAIDLVQTLKAKVDALNIGALVEGFDALIEDIDDITADEQEAYDNLPESLQDGERGCAMSEAIASLDAAKDLIDTYKAALATVGETDLDDAVAALDDAMGAA